MAALGNCSYGVDVRAETGTDGRGWDDGGVRAVGACRDVSGGGAVSSMGAFLGRCGDVDAWLFLLLWLLLGPRRAGVFGERLGEFLVCTSGNFFRCHRAVGFSGVVDGFADLGFGFFLLAESFGCCEGFGG